MSKTLFIAEIDIFLKSHYPFLNYGIIDSLAVVSLITYTLPTIADIDY